MFAAKQKCRFYLLVNNYCHFRSRTHAQLVGGKSNIDHVLFWLLRKESLVWPQLKETEVDLEGVDMGLRRFPIADDITFPATEAEKSRRTWGKCFFLLHGWTTVVVKLAEDA